MNFWLHTLGSLPGMVVQIPAFLLLARAVRNKFLYCPAGRTFCAYLNIAVLLLIFLQPFVSLPGGLLQRMLYAATWLWMIVVGMGVLAQPNDSD